MQLCNINPEFRNIPVLLLMKGDITVMESKYGFRFVMLRSVYIHFNKILRSCKNQTLQVVILSVFKAFYPFQHSCCLYGLEAGVRFGQNG